jgi:hypothetical protein
MKPAHEPSKFQQMHETGEPVLHTACPETAQLNCKHWLMLFVKALHASFACGAV